MFNGSPQLFKALIVIAGLAAALPSFGDDAERTARMVQGGGDLPIAVTEIGNPSGRGILFLHSLISSSYVWDKQLASNLADDFRLIAMDLRGHGSSAKPYNAYLYRASKPWGDDVAAVLEATELDRPIIVASGFGGLVALDYIRHHGSDALGGLVLVGTTAGLLAPPPPAEETPERLARIERSRSVDQRIILDWTRGFMDFLVSQGPLPADEIERLTVSAMLVPHYVRRFVRGRPTDNTALAPELADLPTLFVVGTKDLSVKLEDVRSARAAIGVSAELQVYDGAGPLLFWYEPERFNRTVSGFAARLVND